MGKVATIAVAAIMLLASATAASARAGAPARYIQTGNFELDGSVMAASGPASYYGGFGVNLGAGAPLSRIDPDLQARFDLSLATFHRNFPWGNSSYVRIPVTVGARYYLTLNEVLRAFAQAGLEVSFDTYDYPVGGRKNTKSEINLGVSPGGGVEVFIDPAISLFALGRIHIIFDSYVSMQFGATLHF